MQQPQTNTQKPDANINEAWALFVRVICALACFPHEAFHQLQDWGSKASVLGRGLALSDSPITDIEHGLSTSDVMPLIHSHNASKRVWMQRAPHSLRITG